MALNWVNHTVASSPPVLAPSDFCETKGDRILEYLIGVKFLLLIRNPLPPALLEQIQAFPATKTCDILQAAIWSGEYMDTEWVTAYFECCQEVSWRMLGYPRACLVGWRMLKDSAAVDALRVPADVQQNASSPLDDPRLPSFEYRGTNFMNLPNHIRKKIYGYLLTCGKILVGDWDPAFGASKARLRTVYSYRGGLEQTTYLVKSGCKTKLYPHIMAANKLLHQEASAVFYGENVFEFRGTAEGALAFIHDRSPALQLIKSVEITFATDPWAHFKGSYNLTSSLPPPPRTSMAAWRRLFNAFVHTGSGLRQLTLHVDEDFWHQSPWASGPGPVLTTPRLCELKERAAATAASSGCRAPSPSPEDADGRRNFLQHVARLSGVQLGLTIAGAAGDPPRERFVAELRDTLQAEAEARPWLAADEVPGCSCGGRRELTSCCLWDREGRGMEGVVKTAAVERYEERLRRRERAPRATVPLHSQHQQHQQPRKVRVWNSTSIMG